MNCVIWVLVFTSGSAGGRGFRVSRRKATRGGSRCRESQTLVEMPSILGRWCCLICPHISPPALLPEARRQSQGHACHPRSYPEAPEGPPGGVSPQPRSGKRSWGVAGRSSGRGFPGSCPAAPQILLPHCGWGTGDPCPLRDPPTEQVGLFWGVQSHSRIWWGKDF